MAELTVMRIYYNGELENAVNASTPTSGNGALRIGAGYTGDDAGLFFYGRIDAFMISSGLLSDYQVRTLYNNGSGMEYYNELATFSRWH